VTGQVLVVCDGPVPHARMNYRAEPLVAFLASRTDYRVDVICPRPEEAPAADPQVRYHHVAPYRRVRSFADALGRAADIVRLARVIRRIVASEPVDCIRSISTIPTVAALLARRGRRIPIVANLSDFYTDLYAASRLPWTSAATALIQRMNRFAARADAVIVDSDEQRDAWTRAGADPNRCYALPHGIPRTLLLPRAQAKEATGEARDRRHRAGGKILYIGDVSRLDGIDVLFHALAMLRRSGFLASCMIVGQGADAYRKELEQLTAGLGIAESVTHVPSILNRELPSLMGEAGVLVAPFRPSSTTMTALPNKLLEYLSTDRPIVVTSTPTLRRIVGDAVSFVEHEDTESLAAALRGCLTQSSMWGGNLDARQVVRKRLNWSRIIETEISVIAGIVENKPPDPDHVDFCW